VSWELLLGGLLVFALLRGAYLVRRRMRRRRFQQIADALGAEVARRQRRAYLDFLHGRM